MHPFFMGGLFGGGIKTDEEYRRYLQRKCVVLRVMLALGIITLMAALLPVWRERDVEEYTLGFCTGLGTGLMLGAVILLSRIRRILSDSQRLHQERLKACDERNREIARRAWSVAGITLFVAVYLIGIIGGLFYPVLTKVLLFVVLLFLLVYCAAYAVFNKRM